MEAGGLQELQDDFVAETGLAFSFIFALSQGASGQPAGIEDVQAYVPRINDPLFPVLADGESQLPAISPMNEGHPEVCALSPEFEIISCYVGHGGHEQALADIRAHADL